MTKRADFLSGLQFEKLRLRRLDVTTDDLIYEDHGPLPIDVSMGWQFEQNLIEDQYHITVTLNFSTSIEEKETQEELFLFDCDIEALYKNDYKMDKKLFNYLTKNLYVLHFWPYVRELLQNMTYRVGIKPVLLPTYGRLITDNKTGQPKQIEC